MLWGCGSKRGDWRCGCYVRSVCVGLDEKSVSISSGDIRTGTQGPIPRSPMLEVVKWGQHALCFLCSKIGGPSEAQGGVWRARDLHSAEVCDKIKTYAFPF